jgi:hypothetical protein
VITLAFSALAAAYLLIPNALFRFLLGRFVPVRVFQGTKTEELTRAVVTLAFIFCISLFAVWYTPGAKEHPFAFADTRHQRVSDYVTVASGLYSESMFKDYKQSFWEALWRVLERQGRMVFWYYVLCAFFAVLFGWATEKYGKLKDWRPLGWVNGRFRRLTEWRPYPKFADLYLLPHISQWHVILTAFTFPDPKTVVKADVLMTDDTLYSGEIVDHFVNKEGHLSGLFLKNPRRFDRARYLKEKESWGITRATNTFWRPIPSAKLYLVADKIVNLNLNYEPPSVEDVKADTVERYLMRYQKLPFSVTISGRPRV